MLGFNWRTCASVNPHVRCVAISLLIFSTTGAGNLLLPVYNSPWNLKFKIRALTRSRIVLGCCCTYTRHIFSRHTPHKTYRADLTASQRRHTAAHCTSVTIALVFFASHVRHSKHIKNSPASLTRRDKLPSPLPSLLLFAGTGEWCRVYACPKRS